MTPIRQGGCLCGKARYEIDITNHQTGNCHCRDCQKNSGAPSMAFTSVSANQFRWIDKPLGEYSVSSEAIRRFCIQCGTPLQWDRLKVSERAYISTATLDDVSGIDVAYEIYTRSRMIGGQAIPGAKQIYDGSNEE